MIAKIPSRSVSWTRERIAALSTTAEIKQLRANAERLNEPEIMERCDAVLSERRKAVAAAAKAGNSAPRSGGKKRAVTGEAA
jgi:hypothetical protein